ncbi:MAG: hypothetical protein IJM08_07120 [Firmicutes bacterium]|nr:hypothetical protein [Bacillota bacterium]
MKLSDIVSCLEARDLVVSGEEALEKDFKYAFATDLMSDALAMIKESPEDTLLISGLANVQTLRTAEMLDINTIVFVRGKMLNDEILEMGQEGGLNLFTTKCTMYQACGRLYAKGLREINE